MGTSRIGSRTEAFSKQPTVMRVVFNFKETFATMTETTEVALCVDVSGMKRYNTDGTTLEMRKVPAAMNTIAKLNEHFSKFGTIVNLQVGYKSR